jgi:hypothetical protein
MRRRTALLPDAAPRTSGIITQGSIATGNSSDEIENSSESIRGAIA